MGRSTLIGVIIFVTILASVMSALYFRSKRLPDFLAEKVSAKQAQSLGSYALKYAIKEITSGNIAMGSETVSISYNNFVVQDGRIDSLRYVFNPSEHTIQIQAFVHSNVSGKFTSYTSEALVEVVSDVLGDLNITSAIMTAGDIVLKGQSVINGDIIEGAEFTFEDIFGVEEGVIKDAAIRNNSYYLNPGNNEAVADSITWVDGNYLISNVWNGSGIFVVNGDLKITAQVNFNGILFVFGSFEVTAQAEITGSLFILDTGTAYIKAHSVITFDPDLSDEWSDIDLSSAAIKIKSWLE